MHFLHSYYQALNRLNLWRLRKCMGFHRCSPNMPLLGSMIHLWQSWLFHHQKSVLLVLSGLLPIYRYIRHNHIVELLWPFWMELCHLRPVILVFNAHIIKLNKHLRGFDIISTVPLKHRSQLRLNLALVLVKSITRSFILWSLRSGKHDLWTCRVKIRNTAEVETSNAKEAVYPVVRTQIYIAERAGITMSLMDLC